VLAAIWRAGPQVSPQSRHDAPLLRASKVDRGDLENPDSAVSARRLVACRVAGPSSTVIADPLPGPPHISQNDPGVRKGGPAGSFLDCPRDF
jgi:hypothetical protein